MALASRVSGVGDTIIARLERDGGDAAVKTVSALAEAYRCRVHDFLRRVRA